MIDLLSMEEIKHVIDTYIEVCEQIKRDNPDIKEFQIQSDTRKRAAISIYEAIERYTKGE